MARMICALVLALLVSSPAAAQRLSGTAVPEHYTLSFTPDLDKETFAGRETIRLQLKAPASAITLHAAEIAFQSVTIAAGGRTQTAVVATDERAETATFTVPEPMPAGPASVEIAFTGVLNDKLRGFYISKANGRKYAVSQMEATDARRAFPSFDEPAYKATFDITLTIPVGDTAISNGRQLSDTPGPTTGTHTLTFATTPKMSTYLVALLVGDFVCRDGASEGTPVRVCSTPDKRGLTAFALEAAEQQLAFFNKYFGIKYPFGKLDIVGVPDFSAGAMENAGAITFRERLLLVDPDRASADVRRNVAGIIAHEIAHQWFGDLVTMKWWDDIWLNEGFATWMASKPVAVWRPEWKMDLADAADTQTALGLDALRTTRAIRTRAETPEEINELFDAIAYEKTAAVLRMIESYVGAEAFRKGVASYLSRYSYGNATGEDFWNEVTRVTGKPVDRILRSFVDQPGTPVVAVSQTCNGRSGELRVTQERFVGAAEATAPAPQTWAFPVCVAAPGGRARCELLTQREQTVKTAACGATVANAGARGYYLTEYTPGDARQLATAAARLTPAERIGLLGDEWWMVRSGRHDIGAYLDVAAALAADDTAAVTQAVAGRLAIAAEDVATTEQRPQFQAWIRQHFGPALQALGLPGDPKDADERQSRRATLLSLLGITAEDPAVQQQARALALAYIANPSSLSGTLAPTVLRVAATAGDRALYDQYAARLEALAAQPEEYYRYFTALTYFRDPALVQRTLTFAISPAVRSQDTGTLIGGLMTKPATRETAWRFVRDNWQTLVTRLGTFQGIPTIITSLAGFCSATQSAEFRQFFTANPVPSSERTLQQALERVDNCAALQSRQSPALTRWMTSAGLARM